MSTRKTWAHELAARARRVGWKVTTIKSGSYKVEMPSCEDPACTHATGLHLSASDGRADRMAEAFMNKHGFAEAEKQEAEDRAVLKARKIAADRAAAEKRAAEVAGRQVILSKVSGPYQQAEYVDDAWFVGDHPSPWFKWVIMTPRQAQWILDHLNTNNRPLYDPTWERYAGIVLSSQWRQTHQGLAIDREKVLQDGQHRLMAIVKAGQEVVVPFFVGMDPENWKAIDEGLIRTAAQQLGRGGAETNVRALAAVIRIAKIFDTADRQSWRAKYTNAEIIEASQTDIENYRRSAFFGTSKGKHVYMNAASMAGLHYLLHRENGEKNPYVDAWFRGLLTERKLDVGLALDPRDPRIRLREYLANARINRKRMHAFDQLCIGVNAWNHTISDSTRTYLRWAVNMPVPRITTIAADAFPGPDLLAGELDAPGALEAA